MTNNHFKLVTSNFEDVPERTKRIFIVRHGNSGNTHKLETLNPSLNTMGIEQANRLKEHFQTISFDKIITSKLDRTVQTANIITHNNHDMVQISDLNELHTISDWDKIPKEKLSEIVNRRIFRPDDKYEYSESLREFRSRVGSVWNQVIETPFDSMLMVVHYEVIHAILSEIFQSSVESDVDHLIPFAHGSITEIRIADTSAENDLPNKMFIIQQLNSVFHLNPEIISY